MSYPDFFELESANEFEEKPLDDKLLGVILSFAAKAPTAKNLQEISFVVIKNEKKKEELAKLFDGRAVFKVATPVVICADIEILKNKFSENVEELAIKDASFAAMSIAYAATLLGLGFKIVRRVDKEKLRRLIEAPEHISPELIVLVGYKKEDCLSEEIEIDYENRCFVDEYGRKGLVEEISIAEKILEKLKNLKSNEQTLI